jgi:hypothetical protein
MADAQDLKAGAAELEKLAAELDGQSYAVSLVTGGGKRPHLHVTNRRATVLSENVYSDGEWFFWGWAERIAPIADLAAAPHAGPGCAADLELIDQLAARWGHLEDAANGRVLWAHVATTATCPRVPCCR